MDKVGDTPPGPDGRAKNCTGPFFKERGSIRVMARMRHLHDEGEDKVGKANEISDQAIIFVNNLSSFV